VPAAGVSSAAEQVAGDALAVGFGKHLSWAFGVSPFVLSSSYGSLWGRGPCCGSPLLSLLPFQIHERVDVVLWPPLCSA
jgi:hypothetical protein